MNQYSPFPIKVSYSAENELGAYQNHSFLLLNLGKRDTTCSKVDPITPLSYTLCTVVRIYSKDDTIWDLV